LEAGSVPPSLNFSQLDFVKPSSGFHPVTWERVSICGNKEQGYPMTKFKSFKVLFQFLKLENYIQKHWFDTTRWTMVEAMHNNVLQVIK
jgi:hypothetical protein